MKTINKVFSLAIAAIALLGVSACVETAPEYVPGEAEPSNSAYFLNTDKSKGINPVEFTVGGSDKSFTYWLGRTSTSGTLTVNITNNSDSRFTVPSSVTFEAGEATAPLVVTFDNLPPTNVAIDLTIADANRSIYGGVQHFEGALNCLWSGLGTWYYFDQLALYGSDYNFVEVEMLKSNLDSHVYKIATDPYDNKAIISDSWGPEYWGGDLNPDGIQLTIGDDNKVSWTKFNTGICYTQDGDKGSTVRAYYPPVLSKNYAAKADYCEYYPEDGIIILYPCFYIDGLGGWASSYYPVIIADGSMYDAESFYAFLDDFYAE